MEQADTHPIALPMGTENFNDCIGNNVWSSPCCLLLSCVIVIVPHSSDIKNGSSVSFNSYTSPPPTFYRSVLPDGYKSKSVKMVWLI